MKRIILLVISIFMAIPAFTQGVIEIVQPQLTLENLQADDQPMTVAYTLKNIGDQPVLITRVTPLTSLLKADWPRNPLLPGKTCEVKLTFTPMQLQENFSMRILVYTNTTPNRSELTLTGNLIDNPSKPELLFKYNMQGLKFKSNNVNFGKVYTWQTVSDTIEYYNTTEEPVTLNTLYKASHLQVAFVPEQVTPGKKGSIIIGFDAPKKHDYGYSYESLILSINGSKEYDNRLSITTELREDFSQLSKKELANAPIATFDKKEHHFGDIQANSKVNCDFTLTNTGKSPLFIRKTKASCGCTAIALSQKELQSGQSTVIRVTFDSTGKSGHQYKTITVITNDPQNPECTLTIDGDIK